MAQDLEWFEQGRPQRPVLPSRLFDHHLQQPALLGGGLLQEQLARTACQAQHVDGLIDWGRRGLLDLRSEEHTSELQSHSDLVCRLLLEKKNKKQELIIRIIAHVTNIGIETNVE